VGGLDRPPKRQTRGPPSKSNQAGIEALRRIWQGKARFGALASPAQRFGGVFHDRPLVRERGLRGSRSRAERELQVDFALLGSEARGSRDRAPV